MTFLLLLALSPLKAAEEKDWTLDLKTSTLVPKYVGTVKELRGEVKVEDRLLQKGAKVYPRDVIKTDDKSFLKLELIDETQITLGPKSEFQVEKWAFRTKNDRDAVFFLMRGKMRAEIKSKARKRDQLQIKSPLVAMGIRGTELMVNNNFQQSKEITQVALLKGSLHLTLQELKEKLDLRPGDYIEVIKGLAQTIKKVKTLSDQELKELLRPQLPDQYNLLAEAILVDGDEPQTRATEDNAATSDDEDEKDKTEKAAFPGTLKEKIKVLNQVREENRKR